MQGKLLNYYLSFPSSSMVIDVSFSGLVLFSVYKVRVETFIYPYTAHSAPPRAAGGGARPGNALGLDADLHSYIGTSLLEPRRTGLYSQQ